MQLFAEGRIDAFLGFPPEPQELRERGIGRVIVNSTLDRPWSQYYCCLLAGYRPFVEANPAATKRVVRAVLKAADLCAGEPERVARRLVEGGFAASYAYALQSLTGSPVPADGATTTRRTPCGSMRCGSTRRASSSRAPPGSSRTAPTGASSNEIKRELKA